MKLLGKDIFINFSFTYLENKPGSEMIRFGIGRHDYIPFARLDLWHMGFRISHDPNYFSRFEDVYRDRLNREQLIWSLRFITDYKEHNDTTVPVINKRMYHDLCIELKSKGWV